MEQVKKKKSKTNKEKIPRKNRGAKEKNTEKGKSISVISFILREARGQKRWLALSIVASLVAVFGNFLMPQLVRYTVDSVIDSQPSGLPGFINRWLEDLGGRPFMREHLILVGAAVVAAALVSNLFNYLCRHGLANGTEGFCRNLREKLFSHVQSLPFKWHVSNQTGDVIQRCTSDLDVIRNFMANQLLEVVRTTVLVIVALALMLSMNVQLTLVSLLFMPLIIGYSYIFSRMIGRRFLAADEAEGELTVNVQENLTGVRVVRAFGRESHEMEKFDEKNFRFSNLWVRLGQTLGFYWGIGDIVTGLQIFSIILVGAIFAVRGDITLGEYVVFVAYNQQLAWPVRNLGRVISEMSKAGVSAARIQEILDAAPEPAEPGAQKPNLCCDIRFENVTFSYDKQQVLKNISFTIPKGSTFGILGATGSGKSTMTYLLNRLYDLQDDGGKIWFGDVEIRDIDRQYLRRNVGLVLQEPFLFSKTIMQNIAIAALEENDLHYVRTAACIAAVDSAISEFTEGYDTMVGERGVTLSGGQKQRVAIARTLMLKSPIMIFDDSMSAVDLETDAQIRKALRDGTGEATVILISHRINTLMQADKILVLEDGCLADIGTHAELVRRPGAYQRIYNMQCEAAADLGEKCPVIAE